MIKETTKTTDKILASREKAPARPPNPKNAEIRAKIKNNMA